ncbi:MAG: hypothetical protein JST68_17385 [Bacteroidetes bacterium]|nr:hypothetical protein [Bacteroidota bacterium]
MKKTLLLIAFSSISIFLFAQKENVQKQESNAEKFSDKVGTLIEKEYDPIGDVAKCKIQVLTFKDLLDGHKVTAVQFQYEYRASYGSDTKIAVLDADEIDAFLSSIKMIKEKVMPTSVVKYTEVSFKSRSGFMAGCFSKKEKWTGYMKLSKYDSNSYIFFEEDDFSKLYTLLQTAKAKL